MCSEIRTSVRTPWRSTLIWKCLSALCLTSPLLFLSFYSCIWLGGRGACGVQKPCVGESSLLQLCEILGIYFGLSMSHRWILIFLWSPGRLWILSLSPQPPNLTVILSLHPGLSALVIPLVAVQHSLMFCVEGLVWGRPWRYMGCGESAYLGTGKGLESILLTTCLAQNGVNPRM